MNKKQTQMIETFRKTFADASENYSLQRVVAEDQEPIAKHVDQNLATRSRIAAKFSALEDVDLNFLSERMDKGLVERIPQLPVKLQDRVLDASRYLRGAGKNSTLLLRSVLETVNKKPGVTFTGLVSSIAAACSYTPKTAQSRTRNAVNSLVALGVINSSTGMSFSTKGADYKIADTDIAQEAIKNL